MAGLPKRSELTTEQRWDVESVFPSDAAWEAALAADRPTVVEAVVDPDVPLLPPFPAGEQKLESFRAGLDAEGDAGRHARDLLDEQARQEGG